MTRPRGPTAASRAEDGASNTSVPPRLTSRRSLVRTQYRPWSQSRFGSGIRVSRCLLNRPRNGPVEALWKRSPSIEHRRWRPWGSSGTAKPPDDACPDTSLFDPAGETKRGPASSLRATLRSGSNTGWRPHPAGSGCHFRACDRRLQQRALSLAPLASTPRPKRRKPCPALRGMGGSQNNVNPGGC